MNYYTWLDRVCDRIRHGRTPQQVTGRYRAAMRRDEIVGDSDYAALQDARDYGLRVLRDARVEARQTGVLGKEATR